MKKILSIIKKTFKWLFIALIFSVIIGICYFYMQTKLPKSFSEMGAYDQKAFTLLSKIYKIDRETPDSLWDNTWQFHKKPLILISKRKERSFFYQSIYLINMSAHKDMKNYEKVDLPKEMGLNDVYVTRWYNKNILLNFFANFYFLDPNGRFNTFDSSPTGNEYFAFSIFPNQFDANKVSQVFPYFLPHEAFHLYQYKHQWQYDKRDKEPYGEDIDNYPHLPEHYELLKKEYQLLDSVAFKNIDNLDLLKTIMKEWVSVREQRYAKWPQLKKETNSETIEGTATYIEEKLHQSGIHQYSSILAATDDNTGKYLQSLYFSNYLDFATEVNPQVLERKLSYDKGAVLGLILDKLDPKWKEKIGKTDNTGTMPTLYDLIKKSL
jgi:hypothetical protein